MVFLPAVFGSTEELIKSKAMITTIRTAVKHIRNKRAGKDNKYGLQLQCVACASSLDLVALVQVVRVARRRTLSRGIASSKGKAALSAKYECSATA